MHIIVGQASLGLHDFCITGLLKQHCVSVEFAAMVNGQSLSKVGGSSQGHEITQHLCVVDRSHI